MPYRHYEFFVIPEINILIKISYAHYILIMLYFEDSKGAVNTGGIYSTLNMILTFALMYYGLFFNCFHIMFSGTVMGMDATGRLYV